MLARHGGILLIRFSNLVFVVIVLGCGATADFPIGDASGDAPSDAVNSEGGAASGCAALPVRATTCSACLRDRCCAQFAACVNDPVCLGCFRAGRYTACAGRPTATNLIYCESGMGCGFCSDF